MNEQIKEVRTTVTLNSMQDRIKSVTYALMKGTTTTFCQLEMVNGYSVWGMSACVDASKYNRSLGEKYSYEDAINKLWPLEGYLLAEDLHRGNAPLAKDQVGLACLHTETVVKGSLAYCKHCDQCFGID